MKHLRTFPQIFLKHANEIKNSENENLRLIQKFEIATYNLILTQLKKEIIYENPIKIKLKKEGILNCDLIFNNFNDFFKIQNNNFNFLKIENLNYLYKNFINSPIPFLLFPEENLEFIKNFTKSCLNFKNMNDEMVYVFKNSQVEIILLEPYVAVNFGLIDFVKKVLADERICSFYVGFIYKVNYS